MTRSLSFTVTGLSCAGCAAGATRALEAVPGVSRAVVNFANARGEIEGNADVAALSEALGAKGYGLAETRIVLELEGLHCASCVTRVRDALDALPEVLNASVNLASSDAEVIVLEGAAPGALITAVQKVGYTAKLRETARRTPMAERQAREARDQMRHAAIAGALALPVVALEMGSHLIPPVHHWIMANIGMGVSWWIQALLTTLILIWPGRQFFALGLPALWRRAPEMNALVALGTGAAALYSWVVLLTPSLVPEGSRSVYFEAAAVVVTLILLGRALEARAKGQTGAAIAALMELAPPKALRLRGELAEEVPLEMLQPGDRVRILPGARVPLDAELRKGTGQVDEAMLTGEPIPVEKSPGDALFGGTVNGAAALEAIITARAEEGTLARIIAMVEQAQNTRLPVQDMVDRITRVFVPVVMAIAALTFLVWMASGAGIDRALVHAVSVLIIACPCAMGLAVPVSIMVGTGRAAERGILFRGGAGLQRAAEITFVGFDKTGTLTEGRPVLAGCHPESARAELLAGVAALEARSEHPIARAITAAWDGPKADASNVEAIPGEGVVGVVGERSWAAGNAALMRRAGAGVPSDLPSEFAQATLVHVAGDGAYLGTLAISDAVKETSAGAIAALKQAQVATGLISGDRVEAASHVAQSLGLDAVRGGVDPAGKVAALRDMAGTRKAAFVGDGINDAPVLAASDLGIALGTGTDVAMESADVVLMQGDPRAVADALALSRAVLRNIRQNLFWAFAYNVALIPVAAGVFAFAGLSLQPMFAGLAMALSSVFVVSNALRLKRWAR